MLFDKGNVELYTNERSAASFVQFAVHATPSEPFVAREAGAEEPAPPVPAVPTDSKVPF